MAKMSSIEQIKQLKERDEFNENRRIYKRFNEIDSVIAMLEKNKILELRAILKYIPVATIACLEGYFRSVVKELIDSGKPYTDNLGQLEKKLQIKLSFEVLVEIQSKSITVGELIAHVLPCNRLEDIDAALGIILNKEFLKAIATHQRASIYEMTSNNFKHFKASHAEIFSDIKRLFELRHILCHEIASQVVINQTEILRCYNNAQLFLMQISDFIHYTKDPDAPESVEATVDRKRQQMKKIDAVVLELLSKEKYTKTYDEHCQGEFEQTYDTVVETWKAYREAKAKNASSKTPSGTWGSYAYCQSIIDSSQEMIKSLTEIGRLS